MLPAVAATSVWGARKSPNWEIFRLTDPYHKRDRSVDVVTKESLIVNVEPREQTRCRIPLHIKAGKIEESTNHIDFQKAGKWNWE